MLEPVRSRASIKRDLIFAAIAFCVLALVLSACGRRQPPGENLHILLPKVMTNVQ